MLTDHATMLKTQGISFPRSGHGALYHFLRNYFGQELVYCDPEVPRGHADDTGSLCGCGQVPCENPANTFAKNHDFGLLRRTTSLPIHSDWRYLIQFRNPVRAIVSDFFLHLKNEPRDNHLKRWRSFAFEKIGYWNRFIDKWVLHRKPAGIRRLFRKPATFLDVPYRELVGNPQEACRIVINYLTPEPIDEERFQRALDQVQLRPLDRFVGFQFFDPGFFAEIESRTEGRMAQANIPSFADAL